MAEAEIELDKVDLSRSNVVSMIRIIIIDL